MTTPSPTPTPSPTTATPNTDAQNAAILATIIPFLEKYQTSPTDTTTTTSQTSITKLTKASAKALLLQTLKDTGLNYKLTASDIDQFMTEFDAAQKDQIDKVVQTARTQITPGATADAQKKVIESVARQEFPSFFKPTEFASNFLWKKIDFKDTAVLGNKALGALESVRGLVDAFHLLSVDDNSMRTAAKQIAMGKMTIQE